MLLLEKKKKNPLKKLLIPDLMQKGVILFYQSVHLVTSVEKIAKING